MNRSTGAFVKPTFHDFCIVIAIEDGHHEQVVLRESHRRVALAKAFAGRKGRIIFCKTPEQMTSDERWSWGVPNVSDQIALDRENRERRTEAQANLDLY